MSRCDVCGSQESMPYHCRHCGGTHCGQHRLPEAHDCPGLDNWGDPDGVFDSGFDDSVSDSSQDGGGLTDRVTDSLDSSLGGPLAYVRGNVAYTFLGIIWVVFLLQHVVLFLAGQNAFRALFVLAPGQLLYVWTWVTSIFSHAPVTLFHVGSNSIFLYFFGPVLERRIGSKRFAVIFLATGIVAGFAQIGSGFALGNPVSAGVLGASGAIMGIMGVLTVLNPRLTVYLYFILPVPLWLFTLGFAGLSVFGALSGWLSPAGGGNVAHVAHLAGLVLGLLYGQYLKQQGTRPPQQLRLGSRRRGPGGPGGPGGGRGPL